MGMSDTALAHLASPTRITGAPVLVVHSWWGLTGSFTAYADALADRGFVTGCVDLFGGRLAATESEARLLRSAKRREPAYRTLQRALGELAAGAGGPDPAVIGFSMGGHWAIWLAQHPGPLPQALASAGSTRKQKTPGVARVLRRSGGRI